MATSDTEAGVLDRFIRAHESSESPTLTASQKGKSALTALGKDVTGDRAAVAFGMASNAFASIFQGLMVPASRTDLP